MDIMPMIQSMPAAIVAIDCTGHVVCASERARSLLAGRAEPDLMPGSDFLAIFDPVECNSRCQLLSRELGLSFESPLDALTLRLRLFGHDFWTWSCLIADGRRLQCDLRGSRCVEPPALPEPGQPAYTFLISLSHPEESPTAALMRNQDQFRVIASAAPIGIYQTDREGLCTYVNPKWEEIAGMQFREARGHGWSQVIHPDDRDAVFALWQGVVRDGVPFAHEFRFRLSDMSERWVRSQATAVRASDEHIVGYIGTCEDITDRKLAELERVDLLHELEQRNTELNEFVYVVSHDLKTPLRGISSLATWLAEDYADRLDSDGVDQLRLIVNRVSRMTLLIDGILRYSRLGRVDLDFQLLSLDQLVRDLWELLAPPSHIRLELPQSLPTILADHRTVQQVLLNLMDNAVKYNDKTAGVVRIAVEQSGHEWHVLVNDNGPGIEQRYFEKIFQLFRTLSSKDESFQTGVGLALVKKAVEVVGGRLWLESEIGTGSTFHFTLPSTPSAVSPFDSRRLRRV